MTTDRPKAVSRSSISEQAEEHIRSMVLDGTLVAGERLNEVAIAESIGISRGPLREAIRRLSGQGYLTMETHRGAFVKSYEPKEIIDLYELRSALELYAVRLAVRRATDEQIADFFAAMADERDRTQRESSAEAPQSAGPYVAELDFHQRLVDLSGNDAIRSQLLDANHKLYLALSPTHRSAVRKKHTMTSHFEIFEAVRDRDEDRCVELLRGHLIDSMRNSLRVMGLEYPHDTTPEGTAP